MTKEIWALVPAGDVRAATRALESGATALVSADTTALRNLSRAPVYQLGKDALKGPGAEIPLVALESPQDQQRARELLQKHGTVAVDPRGWKVIPAENLVAWAGDRGRVLVKAATVEEALVALRALERGVDGVIVDAPLVKAVADGLRETPALPLTEAEVIAVEPIGPGDRVCVDTTVILTPDEGLLVGSQASHLFLILSENADTGYVAARPFRVNAGAVHQYVLSPDGRTAYLSEAQGGTRVLVAGANGETRAVTVGRAKVEHRPLVLVRARAADGAECHCVLQDAETIRLATSTGAVSVSQLHPGTRVLLHAAPSARHFGVAIEERVVER